MKSLILPAITLLFASSPILADENMRTLFSFDDAKSAEQWSAVNDGVMGGRSDGRFQMTEKGAMRFFGNLSLENNGGFASVRSKPTKLELNDKDVIIARVRGDGRTYTFNLYTPSRRIAFSYRNEFKTIAGEWREVELPLKDFTATWFGRSLKNMPLRASEVNSVGILLGDKKAGPFELEIDFVKVARREPAPAN